MLYSYIGAQLNTPRWLDKKNWSNESMVSLDGTGIFIRVIIKLPNTE